MIDICLLVQWMPNSLLYFDAYHDENRPCLLKYKKCKYLKIIIDILVILSAVYKHHIFEIFHKWISEEKQLQTALIHVQFVELLCKLKKLNNHLKKIRKFLKKKEVV